MSNDLRYDVGTDGVATLTFDRPEVMNAIRPQMTAEILAVVDEVRHDDDVRCLLITGEGSGFCAGDDFTEIFLADDRGERKIDREVRRIKEGETSLDVIFGLEKPTVAAVNGPAVGYGMDIALYCDIRIASDAARFGWFFVRRGVVGTIGGTFILRQLVGLSKAMELTLTGDLIDADEALRIGLVSRVVPAEELATEARALAAKLAAGPPLAQRAVKRAMHAGFRMDWRDLGEYQQALGDVLWQSADHHEGVASFVERRPPRFEGR
jgi:enoyl-CoA hydratase/carnithine racemase